MSLFRSLGLVLGLGLMGVACWHAYDRGYADGTHTPPGPAYQAGYAVGYHEGAGYVLCYAGILPAELTGLEAPTAAQCAAYSRQAWQAQAKAWLARGRTHDGM